MGYVFAASVFVVWALSYWCAYDSGYDRGWLDHFDAVNRELSAMSAEEGKAK